MSEKSKSSRMPISVGSLLWIALIVWLVTPNPGSVTRNVEALRGEVRELQREIGALRAALREPAAGASEAGSSAASEQRAERSEPATRDDHVGGEISGAPEQTPVDTRTLDVERD